MHSRVGKPLGGIFPLMDINEYFTSRKTECKLKRDHLLNMRLRFIVLNLIYVDQFGESPFDVRFEGNSPHVDHIYPQSLLRSTLKLPTPQINHIGNYLFVGATDNIRKRAEKPADYFGRLKSTGVNIAHHLLLRDFADDPSRLRFDAETYRRFRDERLARILEIATRVVSPEDRA